ncbi:hypothetical protein SKAU_G00065860 [Synaphobranchus kaupii]|uniref:Uncharacterized protein n=1 Tax=Synaphobranchus kaupii TaxID=118154 RepID=A0A9Q1JA28_SYNKA|nr:hypothetical protein SKAU_G00065860 [Synaphobranchus kaupii]
MKISALSQRRLAMGACREKKRAPGRSVPSDSGSPPPTERRGHSPRSVLNQADVPLRAGAGSGRRRRAPLRREKTSGAEITQPPVSSLKGPRALGAAGLNRRARQDTAGRILGVSRWIHELRQSGGQGSWLAKVSLRRPYTTVRWPRARSSPCGPVTQDSLWRTLNSVTPQSASEIRKALPKEPLKGLNVQSQHGRLWSDLSPALRSYPSPSVTPGPQPPRYSLQVTPVKGPFHTARQIAFQSASVWPAVQRGDWRESTFAAANGGELLILTIAALLLTDNCV